MLIRNATLPDCRTGVDLLVRDGRIAAVGEQQAQTVDGNQRAQVRVAERAPLRSERLAEQRLGLAELALVL